MFFILFCDCYVIVVIISEPFDNRLFNNAYTSQVKNIYFILENNNACHTRLTSLMTIFCLGIDGFNLKSTFLADSTNASMDLINFLSKKQTYYWI